MRLHYEHLIQKELQHPPDTGLLLHPPLLHLKSFPHPLASWRLEAWPSRQKRAIARAKRLDHPGLLVAWGSFSQIKSPGMLLADKGPRPQQEKRFPFWGLANGSVCHSRNLQRTRLASVPGELSASHALAGSTFQHTISPLWVTRSGEKRLLTLQTQRPMFHSDCLGLTCLHSILFSLSEKTKINLLLSLT